MTSCVACHDGVTPSGGNCPNGCNQNVYCDPEAPVCVECPTCLGYGEVQRKSLTGGYYDENCPDCKGSGCKPV